jgi:predicted Zn-dependent protease
MSIRQILAGLATAMVLGACALPTTAPLSDPSNPPASGSAEEAVMNFVAVVEKVQPVAEAICRERTRNVPCKFQIAVDDNPNDPPNAFQTVDSRGNPILAFNIALILDVRNADEMAFVMGHEAAHHIAGHMSRQQETALAGAIVAGTLASLGGGDEAAVRAAQDLGAQMGARTFSKDFELEADALGTEIAWRAGFDPLKGAEFFSRLPDPGNRFLGSHPPNESRRAVVQQTMDILR